MTRHTVRRLARVAAFVLVSLPAAASASPPEPGWQERGPDGTVLACNFNFALQSVGSGDASTDCDGHYIALARNAYVVVSGTITVRPPGAVHEMTYRLGDMPLNEPVLLLDGARQPTRVIARRRGDRVDFVVGQTAFRAPPPRLLLPRTVSASRNDATPTSSDAVATRRPSGGGLIGTWRAQGVLLTLRADGSFSRVSHSSPGVFGAGVMDDHGSYEVHGGEVVLHGGMYKRTCGYDGRSASLVCNGVSYRLE